MSDIPQALEHINTELLIPYARNSRTHSLEQIQQIANSIREFGFTNPVLIDSDNGIIAGHGRVMAAQNLALSKVPCLRLAYLTEAQKRAYIIADNQLALNSGWDEAMLKAELQDLQAIEFDLDLLGFDVEFLEDMLEEEPLENTNDADAVPDVPVNPVTKMGDVWLLGNHRLMCGDSTSADCVTTLLGGGMPHLMVTDPPYGVEYDAEWRNFAMRSSGTVIGGRAIGKVLNDDKADWREAWALFPGEVAYIWHAPTRTHEVVASLHSCDFELRSLIIWAKNTLVISRCHYHPKHEQCWYAVKKGGTGHWNGDRTQTTVWDVPKPKKSETGHSTQKPVECMRKPIENNSRPGDEIYEPFSGSGTTIIAAEQTKRICYAMELSPNYVDMAVTRWQNFTGKQAILEATGQTFDEMSNG
jgi:DNA modification methylase